MNKLKAKLIYLEPEIAEKLRKRAYVNRTNQTTIIKNALDFYFMSPEQRRKEEELSK